MNKQYVLDLISQLNIAEHAYYVLNKPVMSDGEYDKLFNELKEIEKNYSELIFSFSPTQRVTGTPDNAFNQVEHKQRMYSLDNSESLEDIQKWIEKNEKLTDLNLFPITVEPKIDGLAISLIYKDNVLQQGLTRGDGIIGEDVTHNIKTIKNIPLKLPDGFNNEFEIRGEIYMPSSSFDELNKQKVSDKKKLEELLSIEKNQLSEMQKEQIRNLRSEGVSEFINSRNAAAGSLRQKNSEITATRDLRLLAYQLIQHGEQKQLPYSEQISKMKLFGFNTNNIFEAKNIKEIKSYLDNIESSRNKLEFQIDGAVLKVNSTQIQDELGYTAKSPRWALAYKFSAEEQTTKILDIKLQVGRTGAITPVAVLDPVNVGGALISFATLHNPDEIKRKDLRINDFVIVKRAGDVIPEVVSSIKERRDSSQKVWEMQKICPCGEFKIEFVKDEKVPRCSGFQNCKIAKKETLIFFASKSGLDIDGLGRETVEVLISNNLVQSFEDFYNLTFEQLIVLPQWKDKKTNNLLEAISKSISSHPYDLLSALGIRYIGNQTAKLLLNSFGSLNEVFNASTERIEGIHGLSTSVASSLKEWYERSENKLLLQRLKEIGFNTDQKIETTKGVFNGRTFVLTGTLVNYSRQEATSIVESFGGIVTSSVSKNTNFVVAGEKAGSKLEKAKKLGLEIIDENKFEELFELNS
ncbi:MAG: NAD-dependent DNA ligase LigA [Actinomycetota bacterium]|nr:NAD-dependent DNA ligase LigA [Actinomycetota bacterium]